MAVSNWVAVRVLVAGANNSLRLEGGGRVMLVMSLRHRLVDLGCWWFVRGWWILRRYPVWGEGDLWLERLWWVFGRGEKEGVGEGVRWG